MYKRSAIAIILLLLPSSPKVANAFVIPYMEKGLERQLQSITQTAAVIDRDGRRTEPQFAAENKVSLKSVQDRFGATGTLKCGRFFGSAQLTGDDQTITTAAHMFHERETCNSVIEPTACKFIIIKDGNQIETEVGSLVESGFKCPSLPEVDDDWAVLKLKKRVVGVKAYKLPTHDTQVTGSKVIAVNGRNADIFHQNSSGQKEFPKTIEDCESKKTYRTRGTVSFFETNCDSSEASSGSGILMEDVDGDMLVGITVGNNETVKQSREAIASGVPKSGVYAPGQWYSGHVRVAGKLLSVLESETSGLNR